MADERWAARERGSPVEGQGAYISRRVTLQPFLAVDGS